jgi:hypothetical protein
MVIRKFPNISYDREPEGILPNQSGNEIYDLIKKFRNNKKRAPDSQVP